jgi:cyclic pyranopterin phosphate synthase
MTVDEFRYVITNALRFGLRKVRLTGGEPLLHPQCLDMLRIAKNEVRIETVGFNTNGTLRSTLLRIVREKLVDKLVIGLDYQDADVSKDSPIGLPSRVVLETIVLAKALGQDVAIACVFDGNYAVVEDLAAWCLEHEVTLKILQVTNNNIEIMLSHDFVTMTERLMIRFALDRHFLGEVGDYYGVARGGTRIFFFHSHCRLRDCGNCGAIHMRVTSDGFIKTCIQEDLQFPLLGGEFDRNLLRAIANVGHAPETRNGTASEPETR